MKGVILEIDPQATVVDLTHEIPPGDIRNGAFALMASHRYFPKGTVHLVVVDPGVGSQRKAIAVETAAGFFVGPDNGVLSWALSREKIRRIRRIEEEEFFLRPVSRTFHGRDIFAPVAARLGRGLAIERLGREEKVLVRLPWPRPSRRGGEVAGEIMYIDRFGNAISNIEPRLMPGRGTSTYEVVGQGKLRCTLAGCYEAVPAGSPAGVIGSSGFLEVAVNGGSAERKYHLRLGDSVVVRRRTA